MMMKRVLGNILCDLDPKGNVKNGDHRLQSSCFCATQWAALDQEAIPNINRELGTNQLFGLVRSLP